MSYCRHSSDDWMSDVYVYCSDQFHICVGYRRYEFTEPLPPKIPEPAEDAPDEEWDAYEEKDHQRWCTILNLVPYKEVPMPGPYAGQDFIEPDEQSTLKRLYELRGLGYHIPQHAIDRLESESREEE